MDEETEATLRSLHARNLAGLFAENSGDAKNKILDLILTHATIHAIKADVAGLAWKKW